VNRFDLDYIDSMRGIAILMVLAVHSTLFFDIFNIMNLPLGLENILHSGKYGVSLFFIVSAYTLFRSLDIRKENGFKDYYIRRFFRIAPLYYLVIILLFTFTTGKIFYMQEGTNDISLFNLATHMFFINGFFTSNFNSIIGVEWTIFVEIFFYMILPVIFIYRKYLLKISLFLFIIAILNALIMKLYPLNELERIQLYFSPLAWFIVFMLGILIYSYQTMFIKTIFIKFKKHIAVSIVLLFILLSYVKLPGNYLIFSILLASFFMLNKYNKITFFNNLLLKRIGELSFSIYLIHMPIFALARTEKMGGGLMIFDNQILNYIFFTLCLISIIVAISFILYKYIEQPFMKLGKNYIKEVQNDK